jgi:hypothetical protein
LLHLHEKDFLKTRKVSKQVLRTFHAIKVCRTKYLGGHKKNCKSCGYTEISYNSCRNRHCPKCQAVNRERWIKEREAELLSVPYFHIVFTLPHEFNELVLINPKEVYNALFRASWQTIQQFASDPAHLGAKTGMTAVLHTWGQNLSLHPHVHCIVPGGGINKKGEWVLPKKSSKQSIRNVKYLFPKKALSKVYRARFMACLRKDIYIPNHIAKQVMKKDWVVYAKRPFVGPKHVIEYLGRYTHKIAISNHRLLGINNKHVSFSYKDYRVSGIQKVMVLSAVEFIRRFALHVLPHGLTKMRHYGILASKNKAIDLNKAKDYFGQKRWEKQHVSWELIACEKLKTQVNECKKCNEKTLAIVEIIQPQRGPPMKKLNPNVNF